MAFSTSFAEAGLTATAATAAVEQSSPTLSKLRRASYIIFLL